MISLGPLSPVYPYIYIYTYMYIYIGVYGDIDTLQNPYITPDL